MVSGVWLWNPQKTLAIAFFLLIASPSFVHAQGNTLSPEGRNLTDALAKLHEKPQNPEVQEEYLKLFPHQYKDFLGLFDFRKELYDGHDFIIVLPALAGNHEAEVGSLLVHLSKDAHKEADALSYLQDATAVYASQHTKTFAELVSRLSPGEHTNLITFLADVENYRSYKEYQDVINQLKALGQDGLAKEFEVARERRSRKLRR
jgi:predicted glycoside hydrolase/deacetylase ChbG (UPF0249 family)